MRKGYDHILHICESINSFYHFPMWRSKVNCYRMGNCYRETTKRVASVAKVCVILRVITWELFIGRLRMVLDKDNIPYFIPQHKVNLIVEFLFLHSFKFFNNILIPYRTHYNQHFLLSQQLDVHKKNCFSVVKAKKNRLLRRKVNTDWRPNLSSAMDRSSEV